MNKKIVSFIEKRLKQTVIELTKSDKGLTNQNYYLKSNEGEFMIRWPFSDAKRIVNRHHEASALKHVADLDVECIYFDEQTGIKVSRFVHNLKTFKEVKNNDYIKQTAQLMRQLHDKHVCIDQKFNPIDRYHSYLKHVSSPMVSEDIAFGIIEGIKHLQRNLCLCHNDWVEGNICFSKNRAYLIDYEYAGDNDPFFDVTSFLTENELNRKERKLFVRSYLGHSPTVYEKDIIERYGKFHNLLWCTWGMMMYESRHEAIYKNIAFAKWNALHKELL